MTRHLKKKLPAAIVRQMTDMLEQICELAYEHPARQLFRAQVLAHSQASQRTAINFQLSACTAPDQLFSLFVSLALVVPLQQDFLHQTFCGVDSPGDALFFYSHKQLSVARYARLRDMTVAALEDDAVVLRRVVPQAKAKADCSLQGGTHDLH